MADHLLICDLRPEWRGKPFITFWRPDDAGYAWPLSWAGDYRPEQVANGGSYYTKFKGRSLIRFAVPRAMAESIAIAPPPGKIDSDAGPVVLNTPYHRRKLRNAAFTPEAQNG